MLRLVIPPSEGFNQADSTFTEIEKECVLVLEHSLVSLSKWESKWCVPFLSKTEHTALQKIDYVKCMTVTQSVDDAVYGRLTAAHFEAIQEYIDAPMTATTIHDMRHQTSRETVTAEIIYYWMVTYNIPFECQKWHLNRLLMLTNVCNIKQQDPKKMRGTALNRHNTALNEARRAALGTRG
jgi:hypothetical protein